MKKSEALPQPVQIQVLGAAGTVTGSKYLVKTAEKTLLVDCGLFQGLKNLRTLNWSPFAVDPAQVDVVLLTHGHLDHSGYLPRLVKNGFAGEIHGTGPTLDIVKIILEDSAKIQEEDAARAKAGGYSKHENPEPLYDLEDVEKTLPLFQPKPLDVWIEISEHISYRYRYNGHIIGATFIELKIYDRMVVFSGDIGRDRDLLMYPPQRPETADVLFIESTYGDQVHPNDAEERLAKVIQEAIARDGTIIIPSFAVERTQLLMYLLWQLRKDGRIPDIPIYMDSPMGKNVLEVFHRHTDWHRLSAEDCNDMCKDIHVIQSIEETFKLVRSKHAKIVIAGSGMATGGRVLIYFQEYLGEESTTILLVGYQAEGTRGRRLLEGAGELKIYGKYYSVRAKVENVEGLSAHADQMELIDWMGGLKGRPKQVYIVHGEPETADKFRIKIQEVYGLEAVVPFLNETIQLT